MRVALITEQLLAPVPGGVGRYTRELGGALAATAANADSVSGWTAWHRDLASAQLAGVAGPRRLALPRRALSAAWARGPGPAPRTADVVHAPTPLFPPRRGRPLVVTIHDTVPWTHPETLTAARRRWHRTMAERAVAPAAGDHGADRTPSPTSLPARCPGWPRSGCTCLARASRRPCCACPVRTRCTRGAARLALPERYLLTLATLEPRKGLDVLCRRWPASACGRPPLLLVGQPAGAASTSRAAAAAAGLPSSTGAGAGPAAGRRSGRRAARRRGAGRAEPRRGLRPAGAEAMAVGVPVIVSSSPCPRRGRRGRRVVTPVGDLVALAERSRRCCADEALRDRLVAAGRARAAPLRLGRRRLAAPGRSTATSPVRLSGSPSPTT